VILNFNVFYTLVNFQNVKETTLKYNTSITTGNPNSQDSLSNEVGEYNTSLFILKEPFSGSDYLDPP